MRDELAAAVGGRHRRDEHRADHAHRRRNREAARGCRPGDPGPHRRRVRLPGRRHRRPRPRDAHPVRQAAHPDRSRRRRDRHGPRRRAAAGDPLCPRLDAAAAAGDHRRPVRAPALDPDRGAASGSRSRRATVDRQLQALHILGVLTLVEVELAKGIAWHYSLTDGIDPSAPRRPTKSVTRKVTTHP